MGVHEEGKETKTQGRDDKLLLWAVVHITFKQVIKGRYPFHIISKMHTV